MPKRMGARKKPLKRKPQSFSEAVAAASLPPPKVVPWVLMPADWRVRGWRGLAAGGSGSSATSGSAALAAPTNARIERAAVAQVLRAVVRVVMDSILSQAGNSNRRATVSARVALTHA